MKKAIISSFFMLALIILLGYVIYNSKNDIKNLIKLNKKVEKLVLLDKELNLFILQNNNHANFDVIEQKIKTLSEIFDSLSKDKILIEIKNGIIYRQIYDLNKSFQYKIKLLRNIKSINAIIINSYRFLPKIKNKLQSHKLNKIYTDMLILNYVHHIEIEEFLKKIDKIETNSKYDEVFLNHIKIVLNQLSRFHEIQNRLEDLNIEKDLRSFLFEYEKSVNKSLANAQNSIIALFSLLVIFIIVYLVFSYKVIYQNIQFKRFKITVENSDNIVVVTDKDENIKYVNDVFTKTTGYSFEEVIGKKPNILKSNLLPDEFYQEMKKTIFSGKKWMGEFINLDKSGNLIYEKATITPVKDSDGNIIEFIALKLDITKEVMALKELEKNQEILEFTAKHDNLTKLPNRYYFKELIEKKLIEAKNKRNIFALFFIDLDGFKEINDNYGHDIGDKVLITISKRMKSSIRKNDIVSRLGGDEFIIGLQDINGKNELIPILEQLLEVIKNPIKYDNIDKELFVTASIGVSLYNNEDDIDSELLLKKADQAMYKAKNSGKNQYYFYDRF